MNYFTSISVRHLNAHGWHVFPPPVPPTEFSAWLPTRGKAIIARKVTMANEDHVSYRVKAMPNGPDRMMSLRAWHRWVRHTRAKRVV